MIREFKRDDINKVADASLDTNIKRHIILSRRILEKQFQISKALLLAGFMCMSMIQKYRGFIGLNNEYVEGIFVSGEMQSQV